MMKKESNSAQTLSENIPFRQMTEVENKQMTMLTKNSFFKEKYRHALKVSTQIKVLQLYTAHPEWTTKDVLIAVLKGYDASLPSVILLEMAQFIMTEWEMMQPTKSETAFDFLKAEEEDIYTDADLVVKY